MLRDLVASPSPAHLHKYIFLCFADLKNYNFTYWMALPAIVPKDLLVLSCAAMSEPPVSLPSLYAHLAAAATAEDAAPRVLDVFYMLDGALFPVQAEAGIPGAAHALVVCVRDDGAASHVGWRGRNCLLLVSLLLHRSGRESMEVHYVALRNGLLNKQADVGVDELGESVVLEAFRSCGHARVTVRPSVCLCQWPRTSRCSCAWAWRRCLRCGARCRAARTTRRCCAA